MNRLREIFEFKHDEVIRSKAHTPLAAVREAAANAEPARGFVRSLESAKTPLALIAEVKKASPSMGMIREAFDPAAIAVSYEQAGAHAISVLTDERFFSGSLGNLQKVRDAVALPCLRKDFIDDAYQVFESRAWGADAILLILAFLEDGLAEDLLALSTGLGMDSLVEVHDAYEAERALRLGAQLIGVNNRSLLTFETDLAVSEQLLPTLSGSFRVAESALCSFSDLERMRIAGANAVLIGTAFCSSPDVESKVREVMGWAQESA